MNKELERAKNKLKKYLGEEDITLKEENSRWQYEDGRGVVCTGTFLKHQEGQGSDVTYFFKNDKTGNVDAVSGSKLKKAKKLPSKSTLKEAKDDYQIYHKSYSGAISEARRQCEEKGLFWNDNEVFNKISVGPKKPAEGKTNKFYLQLYTKDGEPAGKVVHIQVYGMGEKYELNMYFAPLRKNKYDHYEEVKNTNRKALIEDIKELAGVLSESSRLADKKAEIRKAVIRAETTGAPIKKTLKRLTSRFGVPVVLEDPDDDDLEGFFLVDIDKLKGGNEESFVSYVRNDMKDVDVL
jgi:hypothetical protein